MYAAKAGPLDQREFREGVEVEAVVAGVSVKGIGKLVSSEKLFHRSSCGRHALLSWIDILPSCSFVAFVVIAFVHSLFWSTISPYRRIRLYRPRKK
jgi:hypothetical protein